MECMMYNISYIKELRQKCREQNMWAPAAFWTESLKKLRSYYNGVGAESWSVKFRDVVTNILCNFETSALIHDWEFSAPDSKKSYKTFSTANLRFFINSICEAYHSDFSFFKKIKISIMGLFLALLCQLFGWSNYSPKNKS